MSRKTVTRNALVRAVHQAADAAHINCTPDLARHLLDEMLRHISDALVAGEEVKISTFGTFRLHHKPARMGRNPGTGETAPIAPRRVVGFKPSVGMKARVARGNREG